MNNIQFVTEYEYATFALLSVLMGVYLSRRRLHTTTNSLFFVLMIYTFLSAGLHIVTTKTIGHAQDFPRVFNYVLHIGYLLMYNGIAIVFLVYLSALIKKNHIGIGNKVFASVAFAAQIFLLLSTPLTHWIFYFDDDMTYCHGTLFYALPAIAVSVYLYSLVEIVLYRKLLKRSQNVTILLVMSLTIGAVFVQLVRPHQIIGNFFVALTLMVMFIFLENPADYVEYATDCLNRKAFIVTVGNEIERKRNFSVAAFHLEGIEYLAELLGNVANSRVRADIVRNIRMGLRVGELYYLGGWNFAVIVRENGARSIETVMDCIENYFATPIRIGNVETAVVSSVCSLDYPDFAETAEDILDTVRYTLRQMEKEGETRRVATSVALDIKKRENHILSVIKQMIGNNGFEVYYQPIYDVKTATYTSAEALIRMRDPELGFISPEEFIPLAETNGLISEIGELVFRSVCEFLRSGKAEELGIKYIEVNLSPVQCVQETLAARFLEIMEEYGILPETVNFEITETAGFANYDALLKNMNALIDRGVNFSVDDYGSGFSTANYLISLPADIVKIDKSIIWAAMEDEEAFVILRKTIEMLKALNKEIVAEGAETIEMVQTLSDIGCDYLQGYYYSKPISAEQFVQFLENAKGTLSSVSNG